MLLAEQDDPWHQKIEIGRAKGSRPANIGRGIAASADEVDVAFAVDLPAAEEEGVDAPLRSTIEELDATIGEEVVARRAEHRDAQRSAGERPSEKRARAGDRGNGADRHVAAAGEQARDGRDQQFLARRLSHRILAGRLARRRRRAVG
jgi:hypothetical protein